MIDSSVVDIALGVIFVFLVLSLCASALVEAIADRRQWRGRMLYAKLRELLGEELVYLFYSERRVANLASGSVSPVVGAGEGRPDIIDAGLLANFSVISRSTAVRLAARLGARRLPSYIPESVFADILLDWLQGIGLPGSLQPDSPQSVAIDPRVAAVLDRMNRRADGDQEALRSELVDWFKQTMDRSAGEYKRRIRVATLAIGAALVVATNADSIRIVQSLQEDEPLRAALVANAASVLDECHAADAKACPALKTHAEQVVANQGVMSSQLLGWKYAHLPVEGGFNGVLAWARIVLGWAITLLAIGMGADFWFGMMKKAVAIKNPRREAAADESKSPDVDSQPDTPAPRHSPPREPLDVAAAAVAGLRGFQPQRPGENNIHAFWMAHFSSLAYCAPQEVAASKFVQTHRLNAEPIFHEGGTEAYVFSNDDIFVIAFRGTEKRIDDWITDARLELTSDDDSPSDVQVHRGFRDALNLVWPRLRAKIQEAKTPIWLTGHSLGGALAVLAGSRLVADKGLKNTIGGIYTFGQPRVGNEPWMQACSPAMSQRTFRYINSSDIVPHLPPPLGYHHIGHVRYFDSSGRLHHERTLWERLAERLSPAFEMVSNGQENWKSVAIDHAVRRVADHGIARYIACLERVDAVRRMWAEPHAQKPT